MVLESETFLEAYGPVLNLILVFLLASIVVLIIMFAYAKYRAKKALETLETEKKAEAEKEFLIAEKEREQTRRIEETGYSERDERAYEDEDSDGSDDGE